MTIDKYRTAIGVLTIAMAILFNSNMSYCKTIKYNFDELDRLTTIEYENGMIVNYIYDKIGNITYKTCNIIPCTNTVSINSMIYSNISNAYLNALHGNTIKITNSIFSESIIANKNINITIDGGYNCDFVNVVGKSIINGSVTIKAGKVTLKNIVIKK